MLLAAPSEPRAGKAACTKQCRALQVHETHDRMLEHLLPDLHVWNHACFVPRLQAYNALRMHCIPCKPSAELRLMP